MPTTRTPPLRPEDLTTSLKGSPRGYKAEFIQHLEFIRGCLT